MKMTKQLTIIWTCIEGGNMSLNDYADPDVQVYLMDIMHNLTTLGKTDGIQYNPYIVNSATSGIYLGKYEYFTSVRLWDSELSAQEYIDTLQRVLTEFNLDYAHLPSISDIDPDFPYTPTT